jgi:hypothetical protein
MRHLLFLVSRKAAVRKNTTCSSAFIEERRVNTVLCFLVVSLSSSLAAPTTLQKDNRIRKNIVTIDIKATTCEQCGGAVKVIASIEDPLVIQKILSHLNTKNDDVVELLPPQSRAPPQISLFE